MSIRVLVVDDSASMRALIMRRLSAEPDIEVIAHASNAAEARNLMRELNPDVVTLDIEMPGMNGLEFLEKIMKLRPTPVIIVSGATNEGADATAIALELGAVDCYAKSGIWTESETSEFTRLADLVRYASQVEFGPRVQAPTQTVIRAQYAPSENTRLIAIGSSTGGVEALQILLNDFPEDCPPTMIVQHINANFAGAVARRLDQSCRARVVLAETDMPVKRGHVYFAPGGERHMMVGGSKDLYVKLRPGDLISGHRPSVDALFHSVAASVGSGAVGALLTGMGSDGAQGLLAMARAGAVTIAQDEASCTVFGMPRAAISLGAASVVAPIHNIAEHVLARAA